jgi:hypothetical protein
VRFEVLTVITTKMCLLGYDDVMLFVRQTPKLIRNPLPPYSGMRKSASTLRLEAPGSFKTLVNNLPNPRG